MKSIEARLPSTCALCQGAVRVGDLITKQASVWVHLGCAEADERLRWNIDSD